MATMTVTLGGQEITQPKPKYRHNILREFNEPHEVVNFAANGTPYHYHEYTITRYRLTLHNITSAEKTAIEGLRGSAVDFKIDTTDIASVRLIGNTEWQKREMYLAGEKAFYYTGSIELLKVGEIT